MANRRITISIDEKLLAWIETNCEPGGRFATRSHAIEVAVKRLMDAKS